MNPGDIADQSLLWFCPMSVAAGEQPRPGSFGALMEARFETYKRIIVEPFFVALARDVDRRIILVDVLRALNAGEEAFADQRLALETRLGAAEIGPDPRKLIANARSGNLRFSTSRRVRHDICRGTGQGPMRGGLPCCRAAL